MKQPRLVIAIIVVAILAGFAAGSGWRGASGSGRGQKSGTVLGPTASAPHGAGIAGRPSTVPAPPGGSPVPSQPVAAGAAPGQPQSLDFVAPPLATPLRMLDPGLLTRSASSNGSWLYQSSAIPPLLTSPTGQSGADWRLGLPNQEAVRGYAGDVSVVPGGSIGLHLAGSDQRARLDIFRIGIGDAHHVETIRNVPISPHVDSPPDPVTGRVEDHWPVSYSLRTGSTWRPGVYLVKLTGNSGGQSYVIFVVRSPAPSALTVVIPMMTYQAYNTEGGASLYEWDGGNHSRGYEVSFDRPYAAQFGAGQFFWLDFPLVVWLEDHGYNVGYLTDLDIARAPQLIEGVDTLAFSGHSEYWTGGMRDAVDLRSSRGANLGFFGANQAYWQARLGPDRSGVADRTVVCYKDATIDPEAKVDPSIATTRFDDSQIGRPTSELIGTDYAGIVRGIHPVTIGAGITQFAPDLGLQPGDQLPGLLGGEVDTVPESFTGALLGTTPTVVSLENTSATATMTLWINRWRSRIFDAGTFGYSWGLDPRYVASLPSFPADAFGQLTARILAWLGAQPDPSAVAVPPTRIRVATKATYEAVAGTFPTRAQAVAETLRLAGLGAPGFAIEEEATLPTAFEVERMYPSERATETAVQILRAHGVPAGVEVDRRPGS